jgi:predicted metal-dependent phosphoesterase TrpH
MRRNLSEPVLDALIDAGMVDALEVINAKTSLRSLNERAASTAATHRLAAGAGSDAHVPDAIGAAYVEMPDFDGPKDFLDKLRLGQPFGHHWDEPRPWSARVLPGSTVE